MSSQANESHIIARPPPPYAQSSPTARTVAPVSPCPVLIGLPDGLSVSGVTLWAVRLAGVLASRGHAVTLMLHEEPHGQRALAIPIPVGVQARRLTGFPPLRDADLSGIIPVYRREVERLRRRHPGPVVFLPALLGDCYGIGAAIALTDPESIRIVAWQHAESAYDLRMSTHYEPAATSFVGVSGRIAEALAAALPWRRSEIAHLPYGVPVGHAPPERSPFHARALRLVYTGRIEHKQKRVSALVEMSDELDRRGMGHTLTLIGDGPALDEVRVSAGARDGRIVLPGALAPEQVRAELRAADCFVLASRYEGLSVSMLEAMAEGCTPIVAAGVSGASEAIVDGLSGLLVPGDPDSSDYEAGVAFADGVERFVASDARQLSMEAWRRVRDAFSLESCLPRVGAVLDAAASAPARAWPASRPVAFTAASGAGASGTVPGHAHQALSAKLQELAGRRVLIHGAGRHTIELASVLAASPARIVAIADDDAGRWGGTLCGWPIIAPADASAYEATDVVISSWLHAGEIYARRAVYESRSIRVHQLYREDAPAGPAGTQRYTTNACSS